MKSKILIFIFSLCITLSTNAQTIIDTVSIGQSYPNQVWYSLPNDNQGVAPKNNWDIAFDASGMGYSILINSVTGTSLWGYPKGDISKWSTLDTAGIKTWPNRWNSDTSWSAGAFNRYANPANPYDVDWGIYSLITHYVTGDSLYVIKLSNATYKKLWIQSLADRVYTFRYANLDGTADTTIQIKKNDFSTKNFVYYSLQKNVTLDREPAKTNWDLQFTQYTTFIPTPYTTSGVIQNIGVRVAEVDTVGHPDTYINYTPHKFKTAINEIGYDWKSFTGSTYVVEDSLLYFVKRTNGDVWKLVFTGFGGNENGNFVPNGNFIFSKQKLSTSGIKDEAGNLNISLSLYPNPSNTGNVTVIYGFENATTLSSLVVYDIAGRIISTTALNNSIGLHTCNLTTAALKPGVYFVSLEVSGKRIQQKLIVQ